MAGDRATNIKINIDIKSAIAKLDTVSNKMRAMGQHAGSAGTAVQNNMNKATSATKKLGDQSAASAVQFSTMANGMLNLSTSAVQTFTSISNLARAENRAKATAVSLERAEDLLARKQLQLNKLVEAGQKGSADYRLILNEVETATHDLAVKTDKLKIEQEAVTDVYMLFFANLSNVGVSTMMIVATMLGAETKLKITNALATKKQIVANKLHAISNWNLGKSLLGSSAMTVNKTAVTWGATFATRAATMATKLLTAALGPVGLIIMGISAALVAYETNFGGFKDAVNGFLGIQTEFNEGVDDGTGAIEEQTEALNAQATAFKDLTIPMQNYITMQETMARQNNDPRELIRLAKLRSTGFSSGVGSPSGGGTGGSYSSGPVSFSGGGSRNGPVQTKIQSQKPALSGGSGNPFGTIDDRVAFYGQTYSQQRDTLLNWIDSTWDNPGTQNAYIKKYWEIFDISNGFTDAKPSKAQDPYENFKNIMSEGLTGMPSKSVYAPGYAGNGSIFNFKNKNNREMIIQAMGVDIGQVANSISIHDAIKKADLTLASEGFQGRGGRTDWLMAKFGGTAANGWMGNATQAYQYQSVRASDKFYQDIRKKDSFTNAGGSQALQQGRLMFGGNITARGYGTRPGTFGQQNVIAGGSRTRQLARMFGADETALAELEGIESLVSGQYEHDPIRAAMFLIKATEIADRRIDRVEKTISDGLGIEFDANSKVGTWTRYGGSRNRPLYSFKSTAKDFMKQIREDIGASSGVSIPSAARLESLALAFNENGSFSNFNNVGITETAKEKLGLTEQAIFDIRFESTRGDRELLNRIRYVEKIEASSSGTSPL